jgi:hypothetical protein
MPRLTDNYCRQDRDESMTAIPRYEDGPLKVRFTHILNPYRAQTEHARAMQQLTFETIRIATLAAASSVKVRCVCVTFPNEADIVPADFIAAGTLTRTVADVATFQVRRQMPLVFDILDSGTALIEDPLESPGCEDFIIFSNMDIHLQPHFYLVVWDFIKAGYDMIDVHRRLIPEYEPSLHGLPSMFAEQGSHHGGMDCVVFPRGKYKSFVRNNACVGMSLVMKGIIFNCAMHAKRFLVLSNAHLTFHLGNDRAWAIPLFHEYTDFNFSESMRVIAALSQDKVAVVRLIATLKAMRMNEKFIRAAETASGIARPKPKLRSVILRKLTIARSGIFGIVRKAIALLWSHRQQPHR